VIIIKGDDQYEIFDPEFGKKTILKISAVSPKDKENWERLERGVRSAASVDALTTRRPRNRASDTSLKTPGEKRRKPIAEDACYYPARTPSGPGKERAAKGTEGEPKRGLTGGPTDSKTYHEEKDNYTGPLKSVHSTPVEPANLEAVDRRGKNAER